MKQIRIGIIFMALLLLATPTLATAIEGKLDEGLANTKTTAAVFVRMDDQLFQKAGDYEQFCIKQTDSANRLELRMQVVRTLKSKSEKSHNTIKTEIDRLVKAGHLSAIQRYWIVNGFACEADAAGLKALAAMPQVGFIYRQRYGAQHLEKDRPVPPPNPEIAKLYERLTKENRERIDPPFSPEGLQIPWNLKAVGVDRAWTTFGVTGKGVVIAVLDDGMMAIPSLTPSLWINPNEQLNGKDDDGNGYVDDLFGYDFKNNTPYPVTPIGHRHGTLCAGIVAARPTPGDNPIATGIAPLAKIMPLIGSGQLRGYEYALKNGADILSMSYTFEPKVMGHYRGLYRTAHEHLSAAGIVSVGGAGNYAKTRGQGLQIGSPKDIPCVIAAAGIDKSGQVPDFSSRGPVSWRGIRYYDQDPKAPSTPSKPDVTACIGGYPMWTHPDVWVGKRSNVLKEKIYKDEQGYVLATGPRGNSFSGPHVAGVAALMLEANPQLPVWHLKQLMEATCKDMGKPGRDTAHGAGMLQADKAVKAAMQSKGD